MLNKRQAKTIVKFAQDGYAKEALLLADVFNAPNEKMAAPRLIEFAKSLLKTIFARFTDNALTKFITRIAKLFFKNDMSDEELQEAQQRARRILGILLAILAVAVVLILLLVRRRRQDEELAAVEANIAVARRDLEKNSKELLAILRELRYEKE